MGVKIIVSGGKVSELAQHYANQRGVMLVRLNSKFDVRRICQVTGATVLPTLSIPSVEELGYIDKVRTDEIADTSVVIFEQGKFIKLLNFMLQSCLFNPVIYLF